MTQAAAVLTALKALDVTNDNHWTADGLPRLETVKMLASDQTLTREAVSTVAPGFTRAKATDFFAAGDPAAPPPPPADPQAQPPTSTQQGDQTGGQGGNGGAQSPAGAGPQPPASGELTVDASSAQAEPAKVEGPVVSREDEIAALEEELEETVEAVASLRRDMEHVTKMFHDARAHEDATRIKLDKLRPKDDNSNAIQQYLAARAAELTGRGERQLMIRNAGVNLAELSKSISKAPIDAAMARRTGRGGQRPQVPKV